MSFTIEFRAAANRDLTAKLFPVTEAEGIPAVNGYTPLEVDTGVYRFVVSETLRGQFELFLQEPDLSRYPAQYVLIAAGQSDLVLASTTPYQPLSQANPALNQGTVSATFDSLRSIKEIEQTSLTGCNDPAQQGAYILPAGESVGMAWQLKSPAGEYIPAADPAVFMAYPVSVEADIQFDVLLREGVGAATELGFDISPPAVHAEVMFDAAELTYTLPDPNVDLTKYPTRLALFRNPFCSSKTHVGRIQVRNSRLVIIPPLQVTRVPGIYLFELHWQQDGVSYDQSAIVSVEQSLLNRAVTGANQGPLSLDRVRRKLRDYAALNDVLASVEFSAEEILAAIMEPVEFYNETPPYVKSYTVSNFPFYVHWLDATVARLLQTAGIWMQRNQMTMQAEGVGADERGKYRELLQYSAAQWKKYEEFVMTDKGRINYSRSFGILG